MEFEISKTLYDKETILKVIYYYQDKFTINIKESDFNYIINVIENTSEYFDIHMFIVFLQEQQIRETLHKQFGDLRNSIYKKAFSFMEK